MKGNLNSPVLLVLAAGMGSRYNGLKQLDGFGPSSQTILDYTLYDAVQLGFKKVVFVIRKSFEKEFKSYFADKIKDKIEVAFVFQELDSLPKGLKVPDNRVKPWGTGHAIMLCNEVIKEPFITVNADDFYGRQALQIISKYLSKSTRNETSIGIAGYFLNRTLSPNGGVSRGICKTDSESNLQTLSEGTDIREDIAGELSGTLNNKKYTFTGNELVSMNLIGMTPDLFPLLESGFTEFYENNHQNIKAEYYLPDFINSLLNEVDVKVLKTTEEWFGVTYQNDKSFVKSNLERLVNNGTYPAQLWR